MRPTLGPRRTPPLARLAAPIGRVDDRTPSLLRVRFPGTDQMLVVSVLYDEIATLTAPPRAGPDGVVLRTMPLFDTEFHYVVAVLATADVTGLQAFAADGEPLFYHFVDPAN